ncbi:hypothetical protein MIND_00204800 [Mycena indigotica]|uniref:Uncharacterized protein n=1 Tax=Mycena indigotica TaxID=2126181 RepID=A0A8H6WGY1_9AGAR|nr:uncharacterized protein MIND_00204800 [Mycena indigotica]KAF7311934.1 hypothetical protein MIND_00204800 [Mycena indigotica]
MGIGQHSRGRSGECQPGATSAEGRRYDTHRWRWRLAVGLDVRPHLGWALINFFARFAMPVERDRYRGPLDDAAPLSLSSLRRSVPPTYPNNPHRPSTPPSFFRVTMPSFAQLAAVSTLAFAALTGAAPVAVQQRQLASLPDILTGLLADLTPVTDLLNSITASNATTEVVGPLLTQVGDIVNPAVAQIAALAGQPVGTILASAEGVVDATGVATLIQPILATTTGALNSVLAVANAAGAGAALQPLLAEAGSLLNPILATAAPLVNGLLAAAAPVLGPVLKLTNDLGLGPVLQLVEGLL